MYSSGCTEKKKNCQVLIFMLWITGSRCLLQMMILGHDILFVLIVQYCVILDGTWNQLFLVFLMLMSFDYLHLQEPSVSIPKNTIMETLKVLIGIELYKTNFYSFFNYILVIFIKYDFFGISRCEESSSFDSLQTWKGWFYLNLCFINY